MNKTLTPNKIERILAKLGVVVSGTSGTQIAADCFLCGKPRHLLIAPDSFLWECKRCGESGNQYTFFRKFHEIALSATTPKDYIELCNEKKGIDPEIAALMKLARYNGQWLVPYYNGGNRLVGFRTWQPGGKILNLPGEPSRLFNFPALEQHDLVLLCEGEWDALALLSAAMRAKAKPFAVVAAPGAFSFKTEWASYFLGKEVWILYDKDAGTESNGKADAGWNGALRVAKILAPYARKTQILHWPPETPAGTDLRDLICSKDNPKEALIFISENMKEAPIDLEINMDYIFQRMQEHLYVTDELEATLIVCAAVLLSTHIPGDPLWFFLVGPPGSGKTLLLELLSLDDWVEAISKVTPRSLISGYRMADGTDVSLLPRLNGRTLVIKDYTYTLSMALGEQEELYGILRDAYDGNIRSVYGNAVERKYSGFHFTILAGVTPVIYLDHRASLGERFLKVALCPQESESHIEAAIEQSAKHRQVVECIRPLLKRLLDQRRATIGERITVESQTKKRIIALAQLIAHLRAQVVRTRSGDLAYRPMPEIGTRLGVQFTRLGLAIAKLLGYEQVDDRVFPFIRKVAFDTVGGFALEIVQAMSRMPERIVKAGDLADSLELSIGTVSRKLNDLLELKVVRKSKIPGRTKAFQGWILSDKIRSWWRLVEAEEEPVRRIPRLEKWKPKKKKS